VSVILRRDVLKQQRRNIACDQVTHCYCPCSDSDLQGKICLRQMDRRTDAEKGTKVGASLALGREMPPLRKYI
jgi:hypothetical protein